MYTSSLKTSHQRFIKIKVTILQIFLGKNHVNIKYIYDSALSYPPVWQLYNYISASECQLRWQQWQASVSSTALSPGSLSEEETESVHTKWLESSLIFINRSITFSWAEYWMIYEHDIVFFCPPWQKGLKKYIIYRKG